MGRKQLTQLEFLERCALMHGSRYNYSKSIYSTAFTKIIITCPKHGDFEQIPIGHWRGKGCEKCAYELKAKNNSDVKIKEASINFFKRAIEIHGNRFDYSKSIYMGHDKNIIIICSIHGEFLQAPSNHLMRDGCAQCSYEKKSNDYLLDQEEVINRYKIVHDHKYDYSKVVYTGSMNKIEIVCHEHGSFWQRASHHLDGRGCPKCGIGFVSRSENKWLDSIGIPVEYRQTFIKVNDKQYIVDALDPATNIVYEFYGDYWHGNLTVFDPNSINTIKSKTFQQLYDQTINREMILRQAGYSIVSIWEQDWKSQLKIG